MTTSLRFVDAFVVTGILLHAAWGLLILTGPTTDPIAALLTMRDVFGSGRTLGSVFLLASGLASLALWWRQHRAASWLLLPQLALLLLSARDGLACAWAGQYADDAIYPWAFILKDQLIYALVAGLYFVGVLSPRAGGVLPSREVGG